MRCSGVLFLSMECIAIPSLEPFDTCIKFNSCRTGTESQAESGLPVVAGYGLGQLSGLSAPDGDDRYRVSLGQVAGGAANIEQTRRLERGLGVAPMPRQRGVCLFRMKRQAEFTRPTLEYEQSPQPWAAFVKIWMVNCSQGTLSGWLSEDCRRGL
ncbi:hypothetical protein ASPVEDRAFT_441227 [Aspergillus versicolor CBS 583.65]|uniref:Uncharacterized protein n=1 Tax=Aspergillus versicolor CBS 583.65 TaxID=1036611 RepID=A0A1L9P969_ASPVE|nr:uncharacterized protein ASPVEDRAFT_441227 [Aspergillus versicolor CBS 583.65]OJI98036.1 hypothetical protein ASPVEDRAFT_441227 [Aspergillus versicolor CBS 583.65]